MALRDFARQEPMPRFSIVVTTTDRPSLLPAAVQAGLSMGFDDFELIVSDNFSAQPAAATLAGVSDKRLRIIRTDRRLPAPDHWEFALDHVTGEFVMFIGDDNALHPDILAIADRTIRDHDIDLMSWRVCSYFHPDWNVTYGPLPNCGNVLGIDVGTTGDLYLCHQDEVLKLYTRQLRVSGCYPCMVNFLFRKSRADLVRERMGRLFWAPYPDISSGYLMLGVTRPGRYAFLDEFGALGGRSRDSNLSTVLTGGKASRKYYTYFDEFGSQELMPHHDMKFLAISNGLAAPISQGRALMPDYFGDYDFDRKTLALKTVDDLYVDRTTPWVEDPAFLKEVEAFFASLSADAAAEVMAYREKSIADRQLIEQGSQAQPTYIRNPDEARLPLLKFWREASTADRAFAWKVFRETHRFPLGRYWNAGGTTYVDMSLFGVRNLAETAANLPRVLRLFNKPGDVFASYYKKIGLLGEQLASGARPGRAPPPGQISAVAAE
jgi:glycosyltransferase involved in cell wall biosynthesis